MANSEKIGYKKRPKMVYGPPVKPIRLPTERLAVKLYN
jgi:hypothetical protein